MAQIPSTHSNEFKTQANRQKPTTNKLEDLMTPKERCEYKFKFEILFKQKVGLIKEHEDFTKEEVYNALELIDELKEEGFSKDEVLEQLH